jgi:hypothetical protein
MKREPSITPPATSRPIDPELRELVVSTIAAALMKEIRAELERERLPEKIGEDDAA